MDNALLNRTTQQLQPASSDSTIPTGERRQATVDQKTAINQIFELFRFNYHNQFLKAFPDHGTLITAKKLWSGLLLEYAPEVIMQAAERAVKESSYLPNVHEVIRRGDPAGSMGLPAVHAAYVEACRAPSPKQEYPWSHPAVYYAGRASDWYFLANTPEAQAFPVFERNYQILLGRIQQGEDISLEVDKALPETIEQPLAREEQRQRMSALKNTL